MRDANNGYERISAILKEHYSTLPNETEVAELLADIKHYCHLTDTDFLAALTESG